MGPAGTRSRCADTAPAPDTPLGTLGSALHWDHPMAGMEQPGPAPDQQPRQGLGVGALGTPAQLSQGHRQDRRWPWGTLLPCRAWQAQEGAGGAHTSPTACRGTLGCRGGSDPPNPGRPVLLLLSLQLSTPGHPHSTGPCPLTGSCCVRSRCLQAAPAAVAGMRPSSERSQWPGRAAGAWICAHRSSPSACRRGW